MINNENLEKMYEKIVEGKELTTRELYNCGFNQNDLTNLIKQNVLERVKKGHYKFIDLKSLGDYAKNKVFTDNDLAIKIFEKCYELDSTNSFVILNLFKDSITNLDENKIIEILNILNNLSEHNYAKFDFNLYLYLLQYLINLPDVYKEKVKKLTYEDLVIDKRDIRRRKAIDDNAIRLAIFNRDFHLAYKLNDEMVFGKRKLGIQDIILKELLIKIFEKENEFNEFLKVCVTHKKYAKICKLIRAREENHPLSKRDEMIIKLANDLISLNNTDKYAILETSEEKNIERAVYTNNFYQALKIRAEQIIRKDKNLNEDIIYLLLYEICNRIDNIKVTEEEKKEFYFEKIINYINDNKKSIAKKLVKEYLKMTNNTKYEYLILLYFELIELNSKYNKELIDILTSINNNNCVFDIATIIGDFYLTLFNNNLKEAKIYLEIIKAGKNITKEKFDVNVFEEAFNVTVSLMRDKQEKQISKIEEDKKKTIIDKPKRKECKKTTTKITHNTTNKMNSEPSVYEREFVKNKRLQILEENEIVLLKKMDESRYRNIEKILDDIPDITFFYAGNGENKRMVLKYCNEKIDLIDISEYSKIIVEAYKKEDFETALYYLKELLYNGYNNLWIYYRIGLIYFRTCNFDLASDYLTVVNLMNREVGGRYDLTDFIIFIDNVRKRKDTLRNFKPRFNMYLEEFNSDIDDYYGIDNFEELNEEIVASNLDVETFCMQHGYSYEEINLIKLIYAKLYYYQGEIEQGDKFLNSVEHIKDKSVKVRSIQNNIRINRNYYVNRLRENDLSFVRKLKP